jgi:hypothetical protein
VSDVPALLDRQLARLVEVYPKAVVQRRADGSLLITVPNLPLPPGSAPAATDIFLVLPAGYPTAKPSGFETLRELMLPNGISPSAGRGEHVIDGITLAHFCWQPSQQWENDEHELWKRVKFALRRFSDHLG